VSQEIDPERSRLRGEARPGAASSRLSLAGEVSWSHIVHVPPTTAKIFWFLSGLSCLSIGCRGAVGVLFGA